MGFVSFLFVPNAGTHLCHLHHLKPCSMAESVDSNDYPPCSWIWSIFSCSSFDLVIVICLLYKPTNAQHIYINYILCIINTPYMFECICIITLAGTSLRLPEDDTDALKQGVLTIYKILLVYICFAFVGLVNKLYKMHDTYIKLLYVSFSSQTWIICHILSVWHFLTWIVEFQLCLICILNCVLSRED